MNLLSTYARELDEAIANMSDSELEKYFPPAQSVEELLTELATVSACKRLTPPNFRKRERLIKELVERDVLRQSFDNPFTFRISSWFDFVEPNKEEHERIYQAAFSKQLLGKPHNDNQV